MFTLYKVSVFLHIFIAMFWIGGMTYTAFILVPSFRDKILNPNRGHFFAVMGKKFSNATWVLFLVLIVTGVFQLWYKWIGKDIERLLDPEFWDSHFGTTLAYKLVVFAMVIIISAIHDFWLGPKAATLIHKAPDSPATKKFRKYTTKFGRFNFLLGLIILFLAITLIRG